METWISIGGWFGGVVLAALAALQTVRVGMVKKSAEEAKTLALAAHQRAESVSAVSNFDLAKSNADLATAYKSQAEEWKALSEKTYKEQQEYRNWVHEKAKEDNALMLRLTAENADLKARTDLTPILDYMKRYDANAERMSQNLVDLTELIRMLIHEIAPKLTIP